MSLGKMYFRKQNQCWYAKVDGKQKRLAHDKETAQRYYDELGALHATRDPLVRELIAHYLGHTRKSNAPSTYDSRKYVLDSFSAKFGHLKACAIRPLHVQEWIDSLGEIGDTTTADRMTMLQGCWRYGVTMMLIPRSYIVKLIKPQRTIREFYLPHDRWDELLGHCENAAMRQLVDFMLNTGIRAVEIKHLTCQTWKGDVFVLSIKNSKGKVKNRMIVPPDHMVEWVQSIVKERKTGAVLLNTDGNPWSKSAINSAFRRLKERMGEPDLCATTLRHSYCVAKIRRGVKVEWVATLMGHQDTKQVMARYGHLLTLTDQLHAAANA